MVSNTGWAGSVQPNGSEAYSMPVALKEGCLDAFAAATLHIITDRNRTVGRGSCCAFYGASRRRISHGRMILRKITGSGQTFTWRPKWPP